MEKVKVTPKTAEVIENSLKKYPKHQIVRNYDSIGFRYREEMDLDTLIRALYIGYEVEEKLKAGDWVVVNWSDPKTTTHKVEELTEDGQVVIDIYHHGEIDNTHPPKWIIHRATPSEIKQEKERRWWAKHGRDVWELHESDLLLEPNGVISKVKYISVTGDIYLDRGMESIEFIKDFCKVVVFSESRLDVNSDE